MVLANKAELVAEQLLNANINKKTWGNVIINANLYSDINAAVNEAATTGGAVLFPPGTHRVSSNITFPENVTAWFMNGAKLSPDTGITITFNNAAVQAGLYQIFSGDGLIRGSINATSIYPQWWGAKGDDVNDDTSAIQKCLDHANLATNGMKVFIPRGIYKITSHLRIYGNNICFEGAGIGATKIKNYSTTDDTIYLGDTWQKLQITIRDMTITANAMSDGNGIRLYSVLRSIVENVQIEKHFYLINFLEGIFDIWCSKLSLLQVKDYGSAVRIDGGQTGGNVWMSDSTIDCGISSVGTYGIDIVSSAGHIFTNVAVGTAGYDGIIIRPGDDQVVIYCWFKATYGDTCKGNGINIAPKGTGRVLSMSFTDCWGATCDANGLLIGGDTGLDIDGIEINNFRAFDNKDAGAHVSKGKNIHFLGGAFFGNSRDNAGNNPGIRIGSGVSDFHINGTRSGIPYGGRTIATQSTGINVDTGANNNYMVVNCDVRGNMYAGIVDGGTGTNKVVANNLT